jgi:hypothetical protein
MFGRRYLSSDVCEKVHFLDSGTVSSNPIIPNLTAVRNIFRYSSTGYSAYWLNYVK